MAKKRKIYVHKDTGAEVKVESLAGAGICKVLMGHTIVVFYKPGMAYPLCMENEEFHKDYTEK